jgi:hypothetical protein
MQSRKSKIAAILFAAALTPLAAMAHEGDHHADRAYGTAVQDAAATRTVVIDAATKSVNVDQGDVVTFDVAGKSFTWQFDTLRPSGSFSLADIAPQGADVHGVWVYVAQNPLYRN